ncbi:MAG: DUF4419 domain-containing protein [Cyanobacteria bacterium SZAS LIN-2]|nr:DUF4419 domain-containing protein [Cyanobacteria bacterium SZAS LIN-3]MBS1995372.1 DUF4419 domain-containing protein [Cyanobacteria bacterium SZAS LIN-2]
MTMINAETQKEEGITFAVHEVEPADQLLVTTRAHEAINDLLRSTEMEETRDIFSCSGYNSKLVKNINYHALIECVHLAFSQHRPIVFSPDMIWIAIMQGLAQHVRLNVEHLRPRLVKHQGKATLTVTTDLNPDSPESDWAGLAAEFSRMLQGQIGDDQYARLINDFSTTGELERTVCQIALMDIYEPYFEFIAYCVCGIPSITLEGSPADWQNLRQKVEVLSDFEMDFWLPSLRTILDQFERAARGDIDLNFWQNIYKIKQAYGWHRINGWIGCLIPYIKDGLTGNFSILNPLLQLDYMAEDVSSQKEPASPFADVSGITSQDLPSGLSFVPFKVICENGQERTMQFIGGFTGVEQEETFRLRPRLGWAVRTQPASQDFVALLESLPVTPPVEREVFEAKVVEVQRSCRSFGGGTIPGDMSNFYKYCDGVIFDSRLGKFRSFSELEVIPMYSSSKGTSFGDASEEEREAINASYNAVRVQCEEDVDTITEWLRFFDFSDGTFLALPLSSGRTTVKRFREPYIGRTFSETFRDALLRLIEGSKQL